MRLSKIAWIGGSLGTAILGGALLISGRAPLGLQENQLIFAGKSSSYLPATLLDGELGPRLSSAEELLAKGKLNEALESYQTLVLEARKTGNKKHLAQAILGLSRVHRSLGDYYQALALGSEAFELCQEHSDPACRALVHHHQAITWSLLGQPDNARLEFQSALELWPEISLDRTKTLRALAALHDQDGDHDAAIGLYRQALLLGYLAPQSDSASRRKTIGITLDQLATAYRSAGRLEEARERYERALAIWQQDGKQGKSAATNVHLGWLLLEQQKPEEARKQFSQALKHLRRSGAPLDLAHALLGIAQAHRQGEDLATAIRNLREGISLLDSHRESSFNQVPRASALTHRQPYFELLIEILMQRHAAEPRFGFDRQALEVAERFRARGLLELLQIEDRASSESSSSDLLRQLGEIRNKVASLDRERLELLRKEAPVDNLAELERRRREAIQSFEHLETQLQAGEPAPPAPSSITVTEMQNLLDEETALLAYFLGSERSFLWQLTRNRLLVHELPPRERIDASARRAYAFLANSDQRALKAEGEQALSDLSTAILGPVQTTSLPRRIVLIADGFLHYIPFASLTMSDGSPAVEHFEVLAIPSASVLAALRARAAARQPAPKLLGVVADPVFQPTDSRFSTPISPQSEASPMNGPGRLERSGEEGQTILSLVPPAQRFGAFGFDATRSAILSGRLSQYRLVHLATHGELNDTQPDYTHLVFSLLDRNRKPLEGRLYQQEIGQLDLPADLVTLSACNSALGKYVRGEGLLGMTRAFMNAGATRVLVSLWFVSEQATALLMERFYSELLTNGGEASEALRSAQYWLSQQPRWSSPFYWAGFVLQGDWKVIDLPPREKAQQSSRHRVYRRLGNKSFGFRGSQPTELRSRVGIPDSSAIELLRTRPCTIPCSTSTVSTETPAAML